MRNEDFPDRSLILADGRRVTLEYIGEGLFGDFDADGPDDQPLLRFTVDEPGGQGGWEQVPDASYCTRLPTTLTEAQQDLVLAAIGRRIVGVNGIKRVCEELSWLGQEGVARLEAGE